MKIIGQLTLFTEQLPLHSISEKSNLVRYHLSLLLLKYFYPSLLLGQRHVHCSYNVGP